MNRYNNIDSLRFIFSFCVVLIHVPLIGSSFLAPLYRCAVPFFYIVTGFFLYSEELFENRLRIALKKWLRLFLKYFAITTLISVLLHLYLHQPLHLGVSDILEVLSGNGSCESLDILLINQQSYGIYVLWFLLSGVYGLLFIYVFRKYVNYNNYYLFILVLYVVLYFYNCTAECKPPRLFLLTIPFLSLGMYIKRNLGTLMRFSTIKCIILTSLLMYVEFFVLKLLDISVETFLFMPLFMIVLLPYCLNSDDLFPNTFARLGKQHSLNIYIYHRIIYLFLIILLGTSIIFIAAPIVFAITLIISILFSLCKEKVLRRNQ